MIFRKRRRQLDARLAAMQTAIDELQRERDSQTSAVEQLEAHLGTAIGNTEELRKIVEGLVADMAIGIATRRLRIVDESGMTALVLEADEQGGVLAIHHSDSGYAAISAKVTGAAGTIVIRQVKLATEHYGPPRHAAMPSADADSTPDGDPADRRAEED